jgi:hypothetical protein
MFELKLTHLLTYVYPFHFEGKDYLYNIRDNTETEFSNLKELIGLKEGPIEIIGVKEPNEVIILYQGKVQTSIVLEHKEVSRDGQPPITLCWFSIKGPDQSHPLMYELNNKIQSRIDATKQSFEKYKKEVMSEFSGYLQEEGLIEINNINTDNFVAYLMEHHGGLGLKMDVDIIEIQSAKGTIFLLDTCTFTLPTTKTHDEATLELYVMYCHKKKQELQNIIKQVDLKLAKNTPPPLPETGYYINLTDEQLRKLYQKLVDAKFLKPTKVEYFVNAFNEKGNSFEKLEWIDLSGNKYVNSQTLLQLLDSCQVPLVDEYLVITKEIKTVLSTIFINEWGNLNQKMNDFKPLKTKRHKEINSIVSNLKS